MKKMITLLLTVIIMSVCLSSCGDSNKGNDVKRILRAHNAKDDVIKFDDIEWLEELKSFNKKMKNVITYELQEEDINKADETNIYPSLSGLPLCYDTYAEKEIIDKKYNNIKMKDTSEIDRMYNKENYKRCFCIIRDKDTKDTIGSIAGWDINSAIIDYILTDNKERLVYSINIRIKYYKDENKVYTDLKEKLEYKYNNMKKEKIEGTPYDTIIWKDNNNNTVKLYMNGTICIRYECQDVREYAKGLIEQYINDKMKNESNGL